MEKTEVWLVKLGNRLVEVPALDAFAARKQAAIQMGVRWSETARDMEIVGHRRLRSGEAQNARTLRA